MRSLFGGGYLPLPIFGGLAENDVRVRPFPLGSGWALMRCYPISFVDRVTVIVDRVTVIADLHKFAMRAVWMRRKSDSRSRMRKGRS